MQEDTDDTLLYQLRDKKEIKLNTITLNNNNANYITEWKAPFPIAIF